MGLANIPLITFAQFPHDAITVDSIILDYTHTNAHTLSFSFMSNHINVVYTRHTRGKVISWILLRHVLNINNATIRTEGKYFGNILSSHFPPSCSAMTVFMKIL